ncbi:MAG: glycine cleavage T C-terminal barrel domain-containing protein [Ilumatobacter sp.]|uniref:glycine cleavage T C-terminal barrel domain-containing protein n=1 Tax=Ilumatobacter sp. TaxID=1967498 RepID=UPI003C73BD90
MQANYTDPELVAAVGPRVRKSPFFDCTVRAGLTAVSCYNHMWLPMSYGDPDAEYRRLTESVSMWDVAAQRHIAVRGPGADALVQYATAIDTTPVGVDEGAYAPMVDQYGILINDPVLLHLGPDDWRFSAADGDIGLWIKALAAERRADCLVTELDTATVAIQGPRADAVMRDLDVDVDGMESLSIRRSTIDGLAVMVGRSGWSSQGGFEIFLDDPRGAGRLWARIEEAGTHHGIGPGAPNPSERIENVLLSYGTDTGYDADPFELGLDGTIDLDGEDFIGRDALRTLRSNGAARRLTGVVVAGARMETLPHPVPMSAGAEVLGELRAAAWSPRFGANLGLALVGGGVDLGTRASALLPGGLRDLTTVSLPFDDADIRPL